MWPFKNERWIATGKEEWQSTKTYDASGYVDQAWMKQERELNTNQTRWVRYLEVYCSPAGYVVKVPYTRTVTVAESTNTRSPIPSPVFFRPSSKTTITNE